ncbi:type III secretion system inner membrane ring lipoprotein SctJ [Candidatus Arsenophonus nilaparvatae]|uniref:type III secretion system inner membrane ring lipoprotein SctJ n=1 Tax=Candidatus Arsenophonus nilaparvatae TaxID=1247023 RepID=UPI00068C12D0|nr:type III secretion inner membrane ring lipoprotein SctJ [Candidatus Arsenophonus nilaparvatae]
MKKIYLSIIWLLLLLTGCHEQELLKNLDQNQANEVIALLQQNNIDAYKKESAKSGYIIYIEKEDFIPAVDLINRYGLPRKPRLEIAQMFPSDSLVSSPLAEKARLYSGIEQRLAQSLHSIEGIVTAHVHISYELNSIESKKEQKYHVSALIKYNDTIKDVNLLINDIKRFLKNSVNGVSYDDISVVTTEMEQINRLKLTSSHQGATSGLIWLFSANVFIILIIFFLFFLINKNRKTPALLTMNNNLVTNFIKKKLIMKDRSNK